MARRRIRLYEGPVTPGQRLVTGLWAAGLAAVVLIWLTTALPGTDSGLSLSEVVLSVARLLGLLAVFFALVQFMLMARVLWIERNFGLDRLAAYHRLNGYAAISCIVAHVAAIVLAYSLAAKMNIVSQYLSMVREFPYVWMAALAEILFVVVVVSSIYIVRRRLRFESWYFVHLLVYGAITLAFFHQFALGGSLNGHPLARTFWYGLYAFVAANVLFWRFSVPTLNLLRFGFRVARVEAETPTTTSVYIEGRGLGRWAARPGQFVLVRIFAPGLWWQEHPFSLSMLPRGNQFRLTIRAVGDYTAAIKQLKPGAPVLVSGPFGRFTSEIARTDKRLFIAGGVGITPIRSLAEEAVTAGKDSILLYASRGKDDVILKSEIDGLTAQGLRSFYFYGDAGRLDSARITKLVPDLKDRDIYLCGPPPMMEAIIEGLLAQGVAEDRLHYERFSLHG